MQCNFGSMKYKTIAEMQAKNAGGDYRRKQFNSVEF